jgi:hypothetical protein
MADIEIVTGEYGDNYDITIYDSDGALVDLTQFDTITLVAETSDFVSQELSVTLTQPAGTVGVARWGIIEADTTTIAAGTYNAQISMVDSGTTILRKTKYLTMTVLEKIV